MKKRRTTRNSRILKSPKKFTDMGARIPKGVFTFAGSPGTGKNITCKSQLQVKQEFHLHNKWF